MTDVLDVSVVICAYTEKRWGDLVAAVDSVQRQTAPPREIIVVVDHNAELLAHVRTRIPDVIAFANAGGKGVAAARNSGVAAARGAVIAFLDDDAEAEPDWVEQLAARYEQPQVLGVGGAIEPIWLTDRPPWFPDEFFWTVGCSYRGMPAGIAAVRNLIGANMSIRRHVLAAAGGFREGFGSNRHPTDARSSPPRLRPRLGDEETEFCIRAREWSPQGYWLFTPCARVRHRVPPERACWKYFLWRCFDEGLGKAGLVGLHGPFAGLASERQYVMKTLPRGVVRGIADVFLRRDLTGLGRAAAIVAGLITTTTGYAMGRLYHTRLLAGKAAANESIGLTGK